MVIFGPAPNPYVAASVVAVSVTALSAQTGASPAGWVVALARIVGRVVGPVDGLLVAFVLVGLLVAAADGFFSDALVPPAAQDLATTSRTSSPPNNSSRRRQYVDADSGPTGCSAITSDPRPPTCDDRGAMPILTSGDEPILTSGDEPILTSGAPWIPAVVAWYAAAARELPWRAPGTSPYAVLVSEVMLQQTPVARVIPAYDAWLTRWPTAADLAASTSGDAIRMWGRLGYPRRALRLHAAASEVVMRFGGELPTTVPELLGLPGVGDYTARAVAAFALRQRHAVVDTNVRRVVARVVEGVADAPVAKRDLALVEALLPPTDEDAAVASVALMELGALVCTSRAPRCKACPIAENCRWLTLGTPSLDVPVKRSQGYAGTDRQVRGRLLAVLRETTEPVEADLLDQVWEEPVQRARALDSLVADGLVDALPDGRYALPDEPVGRPMLDHATRPGELLRTRLRNGRRPLAGEGDPERRAVARL